MNNAPLGLTQIAADRVITRDHLMESPPIVLLLRRFFYPVHKCLECHGSFERAAAIEMFCSLIRLMASRVPTTSGARFAT